MITVRSVVKFISKTRDKSHYIVRELRSGGNVLIESLDGNDYYIVSVDDVELVGGEDE